MVACSRGDNGEDSTGADAQLFTRHSVRATDRAAAWGCILQKADHKMPGGKITKRKVSRAEKPSSILPYRQREEEQR